MTTDATPQGIVEIDEGLCAGLGACIAAAPDVVVLGDDGIARVRAAAATGDLALLQQLADSCPMAAISVRRLDASSAA